ncbi:MAG: DUF3566 domain-containing protein [Chloroflexota bacterium]|nr:DUF3566 domain-containing protein [Chloroflexota bacterium]
MSNYTPPTPPLPNPGSTPSYQPPAPSYQPPAPSYQPPAPSYSTGPYTGPIAGGTTKRTVRRISVGSAAKVLAMSYVVIWAVFGICGLLFSGLLAASLSSGYGSYGARGAAMSLGASVVIYVIGLVIALIAGAITGALYALVYNAAARTIGGLEVEVQ